MACACQSTNIGRACIAWAVHSTWYIVYIDDTKRTDWSYGRSANISVKSVHAGGFTLALAEKLEPVVSRTYLACIFLLRANTHIHSDETSTYEKK